MTDHPFSKIRDIGRHSADLIAELSKYRSFSASIPPKRLVRNLLRHGLAKLHPGAVPMMTLTTKCRKLMNSAIQNNQEALTF